MAQITKFQDTFTDTNSVALLSHSPETGGPWEEGASIATAQIQSNELIDSSQPVNNDLLAYALVTGGYAVGDEQWMDCTAKNIVVGNQSYSPLMLVLVDNVVASTDIGAIIVYAYFESNIEIHVDIYQKGAGFISSDEVAVGIVWPAGTDMRLGITLTSLTSYDVWLEPAGGGTRTAIGSSAIPPANDYITAGHSKCGIWLDNVAATQPPTKVSLMEVEAPGCFPTDYVCEVPASRIVLADGCIPAGTLGSY